MTTNDGCRADVRKARAEAAAAPTRVLSDIEREIETAILARLEAKSDHNYQWPRWAAATEAAQAVGDLLADRLATDTAAPEADQPANPCPDPATCAVLVPAPPCTSCRAASWSRERPPAAPVVVEGVETVETLNWRQVSESCPACGRESGQSHARGDCDYNGPWFEPETSEPEGGGSDV